MIVALIGLIVVIWAVNFIAAKIGLRYFPPLTMASFRVCAAGLVMLPFYLGAKKLPAFAEAAAAQRARGFSRRDLWTFLYLGFFGVSVNQFCFTLGLRFTSVSHSAVIVGMGPVYVLVLAVLLRLERVTGHKAVGMAIAFVGIAVLASEHGISAHSASLLGDAITMTGSLGFAMYAVLGKRVAGEYDALTMTAYNHFAGALIILPLAVQQAWRFNMTQDWQAVPWKGWAAILYMGIFGSAVAYIAYYWLLRYLEASQLSAFTYLLPVLATLLGILTLGEKGSWTQVLGGTLALGGVYWIESGRESRGHAQEDTFASVRR
ncbi:MAG TPA: EamA family transporter [Candidatus Methylomirabilis sp.]|nr:EamA family transporter [Candidatus Methylomirabilis sp.]